MAGGDESARLGVGSGGGQIPRSEFHVDPPRRGRCPSRLKIRNDGDTVRRASCAVWEGHQCQVAGGADRRQQIFVAAIAVAAVAAAAAAVAVSDSHDRKGRSTPTPMPMPTPGRAADGPIGRGEGRGSRADRRPRCARPEVEGTDGGLAGSSPSVVAVKGGGLQLFAPWPAKRVSGAALSWHPPPFL
ncbi:uncharacterized protein FIBRA_04223 [Fibroporia radiculosa]|uniref:Uncharacterized protein n=1 Tax=Fibroporia radiculosa TaxID=599839 RepID=J4IA20_9APHY|nr:uncharacterized protein FIBRA_04223 [Fibroporia radiculosa]CCM02146.1 predicted protein [Fibroporia radiculosa]